MPMTSDQSIDSSTGLLRRAAFLEEVRKGQALSVTQVRRGCLLILHFPVLKHIHKAAGEAAATHALCNLLAIVETRHRSRDTMGRIGDHSLCILLRQCKEEHAALIAEQYVALLRDVVVEAGTQRASMDLHYRIVPLDWRGRRARQGISKLIKADGDSAQLAATIQTLANSGEKELGQVLYLPSERDPALALPAASSAGAQMASIAEAAYRMKPGMLLKHRPLVCCYRVRPVGVVAFSGSFNESTLLDAALNALSMGVGKTRPVIESQLVIPVDAAQLNANSALWLKTECRARSVSPSDVCLSLRLDSVTQNLRSALPAIRSLNRQGVQLMLEDVSSAAQLKAIQNLAGFDYLLVSAKVMQISLNQLKARQELASLVSMVREQQRQICGTGIDSPALLAHAQAMELDIGFGRECGRSKPFPKVSSPSLS